MSISCYNIGQKNICRLALAAPEAAPPDHLPAGGGDQPVALLLELHPPLLQLLPAAPLGRQTAPLPDLAHPGQEDGVGRPDRSRTQTPTDGGDLQPQLVRPGAAALQVEVADPAGGEQGDEGVDVSGALAEGAPAEGHEGQLGEPPLAGALALLAQGAVHVDRLVPVVAGDLLSPLLHSSLCPGSPLVMGLGAFSEDFNFGDVAPIESGGQGGGLGGGHWGPGDTRGAGAGPAGGEAHLDGGDLKPQVGPEHLLLLVLLEPVQGLLGEEVAEQAEGLALGGQPGVGAEGGDLLLHGIVPVDPVAAGKVLQDDALPVLVHLIIFVRPRVGPTGAIVTSLLACLFACQQLAGNRYSASRTSRLVFNYSGATWPLLGRYWGTTRALLGHYSGTTGALLGHYWGTIGALLGHYSGTTRDCSKLLETPRNC